MNKEKIYVIGHKHPDTDSICSAIAYANLRKKVTGKNYVPARAGEINSETAFVLDRFHTEVPGYMGDVRTPVSYTHLDVYKRQVMDRALFREWKPLCLKPMKGWWPLLKRYAVK